MRVNLKSSTRYCEILVLVECFFRLSLITLSGKSIVLAAKYFPAIDLNDGDYELGLAIFETYYMIRIWTNQTTNFISPKTTITILEITIPEGSYEVRDINEFLKRAIL